MKMNFFNGINVKTLIGAALAGLSITELGKYCRNHDDNKTKRHDRDVDLNICHEYGKAFRFAREQSANAERYKFDKKNERQKNRLAFLDKQFGRAENVCSEIIKWR